MGRVVLAIARATSPASGHDRPRANTTSRDVCCQAVVPSRHSLPGSMTFRRPEGARASLSAFATASQSMDHCLSRSPLTSHQPASGQVMKNRVVPPFRTRLTSTMWSSWHSPQTMCAAVAAGTRKPSDSRAARWLSPSFPISSADSSGCRTSMRLHMCVSDSGTIDSPLLEVCLTQITQTLGLALEVAGVGIRDIKRK